MLEALFCAMAIYVGFVWVMVNKRRRRTGSGSRPVHAAEVSTRMFGLYGGPGCVGGILHDPGGFPGVAGALDCGAPDAGSCSQ